MIEEKNSNAVETLETIELVEGDLTKFTKVRMTLGHSTKKEMITFLKTNLDVSAWDANTCLEFLEISINTT